MMSSTTNGYEQWKLTKSNAKELRKAQKSIERIQRG